MDKKNSNRVRQKKFNQDKKKAGFHKLQVYISHDVYEMLNMICKNSNNTQSNVIENSISSEFISWSQKNILK